MSAIVRSHSRASSRAGSGRAPPALSSCHTSAIAGDVTGPAGRTRGMHSWSADSSAPPSAAWALLSRPEAWPAWSPHVRGAWGLGAGEVREGAHGAARLLGGVPVPARITAKSALVDLAGRPRRDDPTRGGAWRRRLPVTIE